ncbi:hypothetical protein Plhal304r1_c033g0104401 [Plasmopara halstedii]
MVFNDCKVLYQDRFDDSRSEHIDADFLLVGCETDELRNSLTNFSFKGILHDIRSDTLRALLSEFRRFLSHQRVTPLRIRMDPRKWKSGLVVNSAT